LKISSIGLRTLPLALCLFSAACSRPPPIPKNPSYEQLEEMLKVVDSVLESNPPEDVKAKAEAYKKQIIEMKENFR